jgi:hypothetical protein
MPGQIHLGAQFEHRGMTLGWVESVLVDPGDGCVAGVLVRGGRADYLLRVPVAYLTVDSAERIVLDPQRGLDEVERLAVESGRLPPVGEHLTHAGPTEPSPVPTEVLGSEPGLPTAYEAPGTS